MMTQCLRPDCDEPIKPGKLACRQDWFLLSDGLRKRISATYERRKRGLPGGVPEHRKAMLSAIDEWVEADNKHLRTCSRCGSDKRVVEFRIISYRGRRHTWCKSCEVASGIERKARRRTLEMSEG